MELLRHVVVHLETCYGGVSYYFEDEEQTYWMSADVDLATTAMPRRPRCTFRLRTERVVQLLATCLYDLRQLNLGQALTYDLPQLLVAASV